MCVLSPAALASQMVGYYSEECFVGGLADLPGTVRGEAIPAPKVVVPFLPSLLDGIPDGLLHTFPIGSKLLAHSDIQLLGQRLRWICGEQPDGIGQIQIPMAAGVAHER